MLRTYFRYDRSLLNGLSRAAYLTMQRYLQGLRGSETIPGMIVACQTFGAGARFHPHQHTILTGGSWDGEGSWKAVFGWDRPVLRELFQIEVFRFLQERELLCPMCPDSRPERPQGCSCSPEMPDSAIAGVLER
ncbi:transposase [Gemmatimonadota bacterium]